jgi:hypothetical protein
LIELHRAAVTEAIFAYGSRALFEAKAFEADNQGIVRLSAPIAREVAGITLRTVPVADVVRSVKRIAVWF